MTFLENSKNNDSFFSELASVMIVITLVGRMALPTHLPVFSPDIYRTKVNTSELLVQTC